MERLLVAIAMCAFCVGCSRTVRVKYSQARYEMRRVQVDKGTDGPPAYRWDKTVVGTRTVYRKERRINIGTTLLWVLTGILLVATVGANASR